MKAIVYKWNGLSDVPAILALEKMGVDVVTFDERITDYHLDVAFSQKFIKLLHHEQADFVFSFDYFPIISSLCEINGISYISWIYDCPTYLLNSKTMQSDINYIFCFDRCYAKQLQNRGAKHCYHFPLGVSIDYFAGALKNIDFDAGKAYQSEVSFVGGFYNGANNRIRSAKLRDYTRGYLDGVMVAQAQICGYNFLPEVLSQEIVEEVKNACELQLSELFDYDEVQLVADTIGKEVSARERERVVGSIADVASVQIYTGSVLPEALANRKTIVNKGYANNQTEMPLIFRESKINLNITSHTITSGIPLRVFDILACGGFCLTNYRPEIDAYFVDGEELVMYTDAKDACEKVTYYLTHEEERKVIAQRGHQKIVECFTMEKRLQELLRLWQET